MRILTLFNSSHIYYATTGVIYLAKHVIYNKIITYTIIPVSLVDLRHGIRQRGSNQDHSNLLSFHRTVQCTQCTLYSIYIYEIKVPRTFRPWSKNVSNVRLRSLLVKTIFSNFRCLHTFLSKNGRKFGLSQVFLPKTVNVRHS